jgi:hypothetical protein
MITLTWVAYTDGWWEMDKWPIFPLICQVLTNEKHTSNVLFVGTHLKKEYDVKISVLCSTNLKSYILFSCLTIWSLCTF